ncbi:NnrS family protein [Roseovarius sp. EGI FJ00037]|uniref:NnrS family protein n=1 Tax=Roseovarius TaxID=74030 RepID=UPI0022A8140E|nr:NnrS family protein [Roseovarius sp. EGI FJ00037]MCZ0812389.1 NnrS family protein [Roseovarius sp. EGI FJ00037]
MSPKHYSGPTLFSYGFRPFFLGATLFALCVVPVWYLIWRGDLALHSHFAPADWHIHEMIFGYGAAVVAGFLFTAVPNWTGRMPTRGWPLAALLTLWLAGRLALAGAGGLAPPLVLLIDQGFLLAVVAMIAREIMAGRNWRNLKVLLPVTLLWGANILYHAEVITQGTADTGRRLGLALLVFLIMLIGGRILPSFTRNWLAQRGAARLPVPFNRFDGVCLVVGAVALLAWVFAPYGIAAAVLGVLAALLHLARLSRWQGQATWRSPLLLMLHAAYLVIPAGFIAVGATALGLATMAAPAHLFGIGVVGGMTVAVMMRATMGHTGRELVAGRRLTASFALLLLAALARLAGDALTLGGLDGIALSALLWTLSFGLLAWRLAPWLARPRVARRAPSRASPRPAS